MVDLFDSVVVGFMLSAWIDVEDVVVGIDLDVVDDDEAVAIGGDIIMSSGVLLE